MFTGLPTKTEAADLGAAPMSLYRHVSAKEELLTLMVDTAWGDSPDPLADEEGWRSGLSRWAWAMRASIRRHPWAIRIPLDDAAEPVTFNGQRVDSGDVVLMTQQVERLQLDRHMSVQQRIDAMGFSLPRYAENVD